jgi:PAS domain-containing protein
MNQRAVELYGRNDTDLGLQSHLETVAALRLDGTPFPPEALPVMRSLCARQTALGEEMLIHRADGSLVPVTVSCAPLYDQHGQVDAVIGVFDDISVRLRAEKAALAAEELARQRLAELEDVYHNAPVGLCLLDRELRFLRINQRLAEINGIPAAEHIGKTVRELMPALADMVEPPYARSWRPASPDAMSRSLAKRPPVPASSAAFWSNGCR